MTEAEQPLATCCLPGGACHEAGLADIQHRQEPTEAEQERAAIVAWLRGEAAKWPASGVASFDAGFNQAVGHCADAIDAGDHLK